MKPFFQSYREILKSHITIYDLWKWYVEIANIYLFKVLIKTLEKGMKYVQS